jgi:sugar O-acyltransferase (sialic acid O-acetyltransferase NeuD family)
MKSNEIYIFGIGHNTAVTIELAELNGYDIKGLIHYNNQLTGHERWGFPVISDAENFLKKNLTDLNFALSMGDNLIRKKLYYGIKKQGGNIPLLIHPNSSVSRFSLLSEGVQIHANATIQPDVVIKENSIISFGVGVSHNVTIEEHCYIACHSLIGAYTSIQQSVLIGMGTTTVSGKVQSIGQNSTIGAGSLVLSAIAAEKIVYGRPAK